MYLSTGWGGGLCPRGEPTLGGPSLGAERPLRADLGGALGLRAPGDGTSSEEVVNRTAERAPGPRG